MTTRRVLRRAVPAMLATTALLLVALAAHGSSDPASSSRGEGPEIQTRQQGQSRQAQRRQAQRQQARARDPIPPGPGLYLAFDVRPRDYRDSSRYVLEVSHPSGEVTTHDLKKPQLQRRSILVPLPELKPGKYQLVVIAELKTGSLRSKPLPVEIPGG